MKHSAPAVLALRLLGRWTELARRHVPLGAGCACGPGLAGVQLADFESEVLDFLRSRHGVVAASGIAELLSGIAKGASAVPADAHGALLANLQRTLDSFEEVHRRA
jgi:hypothetical protein